MCCLRIRDFGDERDIRQLDAFPGGKSRSSLESDERAAFSDPVLEPSNPSFSDQPLITSRRAIGYDDDVVTGEVGAGELFGSDGGEL
jgi:hypothetical protein